MTLSVIPANHTSIGGLDPPIQSLGCGGGQIYPHAEVPALAGLEACATSLAGGAPFEALRVAMHLRVRENNLRIAIDIKFL